MLLLSLSAKIARKLEIHTIRTKLVLSYLFIAITPLLFFAFVSYNIYFGALTDRITTYSEELVYRMERDIDNYFRDLEIFLNREQDFYINQFIKLIQQKDFTNNRKYTFRIWEDFNNLSQMKPGLEDIALTFRDGMRISSYGLYYIDIENFEQEMNYGMEDSGMSWIGPYQNFLRKDVITMIRPYYPDQAEESVLISADINLEVLADISGIKLGDHGYVFIADKNGTIIYHPDRELIGEKSVFFNRDESGNSFISQDDNQIVTFTNSEVSSWAVVSVAFSDEMQAELLPLRNITVFIIGLILLIVILLIIYISYSLSNPIRELEGLTQRAADNDLTVKIDSKGNDEIAQLGNSFNKMIMKIKQLMEENIEEQKLLRKLEMESLDNQIKPHFIYNTLDLIIGELESNNNSKATLLIEALGNFFRLSLSHGREMVLISNEIEHVKNYLFIQTLRHGEKYEYIVDIKDEEVMGFYILRLVLQPLVENAIYHGILPLKKKGLIVIKAYFFDNQKEHNQENTTSLENKLEKKEGQERKICLEVIDNGLGIEEEKVNEINQVLQGEKVVEDKKDYFGLRNVNQRLKLMFGNDYGLILESEKGIKTKSIVKISAKSW
ncbi:MAG: sensor histidine kinase [bacterium]